MEHKRVQRIRELKERVREVRRASLAEADRAWAVAREASDRAASGVVALSERLVRPADATGAELELGSWLVERARREHRQAEQLAASRLAERERRAQVLHRVAREASSLGALEERLATAERADEQRREQCAADEVARRARGAR